MTIYVFINFIAIKTRQRQSEHSEESHEILHIRSG